MTRQALHSSLQYAGYSVGEVAPIRGPVGEKLTCALAERAVEVVLPPQEEFPYTMRLVSEFYQ